MIQNGKETEHIDLFTPGGRKAGVLYVRKNNAQTWRAEIATVKFKKTLRILIDADITREGNGSDPASERLVSSAEAQLRKMFDELTGVKGSTKDAFSVFRPFACMKSGSFWAEYVLGALFAFWEGRER